MTIQRQYSLPNCTLTVEGLGDALTLNPVDVRPPLSVLINAECRLLGQERTLSGGRDFLESLIKAVNQYTQEFLSGLHNQRSPKTEQPLVQIQRVSDTVHRLSVREQSLEGSSVPVTTDVDLSTVQLFDLVEAVDQLVADPQTLPDLSLDLKPLSRRDVAKRQPVTKQLVPAAIGLSSLAAAALAFSLLPVPKVEPPKDLYPVRGSTTATTGKSPSPTAPPTPTTSPQAGSKSPAASPAPTGSPDLKQLENALTASPEITDPAELARLSQQLRNQLDQTWSNRAAVTKDLTYQVGVGKDGAIVGYKPMNPLSLETVQQTPLLGLVARQGDRPPGEALARYKVLFTASGNVEVAPWRQVMTSPISGISEITKAEQLEEILPKLRSQINQNWGTTNPSFNEDLIFKVRVKQNGTVVDFSPENDAAARSVQNTPLPKLGKPIADGNPTASDEPLALFKVVFTAPNGALEITPWRGWQSNQ